MSKIAIVTFSYKSKTAKDAEGKHGIIYRPDYMIISVFDTSTRRFSPRRIIPLKHDRMPEDVANMLASRKAQIIIWSEEDKALLQMLVQETGRCSGKLRIGRFREYLFTINVPTDSMSAAARDLGIGTCPREGVRSLIKVLRRFTTLRKIVRKVFRRNDLDLMDGIFI